MSSILFGLTLGLTAAQPQQAFAQGCILTRNTAPVLGSQVSPYLIRGEWQVSTSYRQFTADHQYQGPGLSPSVTALGTNVISKMRYLEVAGTYAVTPQVNLSVAVPVLLNASSNRALPATVAGSPRFVHSTKGIGDVMVSARYWFMNCDTNPTQNFSIGAGLKTPTGNSNATDMFPNAQGRDVRERTVDQSIQPGDGGWGFALSFDGFKQLGVVTTFGSGVYLFNPKDQNGTLSPPALLNPVGPEAVALTQRFNTVSDSYLVRGGIGVPIPKSRGLFASVSGRIEGVPVKDRFGETAGFRRPGYFVTVEPSVAWGTGRTTLSFNVPIRVKQNVKPSLGFARDSTFADYMLLTSAAFRFGGAY